MLHMNEPLIAVIDFGSRHSQTVARSVRAHNVYSEVWFHTTAAKQGASHDDIRGIIFVEATDETRHDSVQQLLAQHNNVPTLRLPAAEPDARSIAEFIDKTCGDNRTWTPQRFIDLQVEHIRQVVGEGNHAVCGLSGGVDSSVAAALVHRAIGQRLHTIFVDNGLMRQDEPEYVAETFGNRFGAQFHHIDASERFLSHVAGVTDPEKKRRIIGEQFIRVFEETARELGDIDYLVQGTVYPDVIESGVGGSMVKSHHNVGGLPERMQLKLVEPLRQLFKDEVRRVGEALGLPKELVWRQPFPGPGLAIRIMGEVTAEKLRVARACDAIVREKLDAAGLTDQVWQSFAAVTDTRSVGVQESGRTYGYVVAIRAVTAIDGMSAEWSRLPYDVLDDMANEMMTTIPEVGRVVYDISSKPPATIEWE